MEKTIYSHKQKLGSDGEVSGALGIQGDKLRIEASVAYEKPIGEIVEPVMKVADQFVDKLEQWIPGDQKAMAAEAKADLRKALVNALKAGAPEQAPAPQVEAPAETPAQG